MAFALNTIGDETMSEMNTTPLIDVMLVLLTLLIITLPMQTHAVKLTLPHGPPPQTKPVVIDVGVEFDGTITWNGQTVSRKLFDVRLERAAKQAQQPEIHLRADRIAKYDTVAKVLSDTQYYGLKRIGFADPQAYRE